MLKLLKRLWRKLFPKRRARRKYDEPETAEYPTIRALLDDLDGAFSRLQRLRLRSSSQLLVARYGCYMIHQSNDDWLDLERLEGFEAYGLPSFLCLYVGHDDDDEDISRFFVLTKLKNMGLYRAKPGHVYYKMTALWPDGVKTLECSVYVMVNEGTGKVVALPYPNKTRKQIRFRQGGRRHVETVEHVGWSYPNLLPGNPTEEEKKTNLEQRFYGYYSMAMRREHCINVHVSRGGRKAIFSVPQNRWKYFFRDRSIVVRATDGKRKRIYHAVKSHYRETKRGAVPVKTHYRGARHFFWRGYEVQIVMPGKHAKAHASMGMTGQTRDIRSNSRMVSLTSGHIVRDVRKELEGSAPLT